MNKICQKWMLDYAKVWKWKIFYSIDVHRQVCILKYTAAKFDTQCQGRVLWKEATYQVSLWSVNLNLSWWPKTDFIFLATVTLTWLFLNPVTRQGFVQGNCIPSVNKIRQFKFKLLTGNWFSIFSNRGLDLGSVELKLSLKTEFHARKMYTKCQQDQTI